MVPSGRQQALSRAAPGGGSRRGFWLVAVACLMALAGPFTDGAPAVGLTLLWLLALAGASLSLVGGRSGSLPMALVLVAFSLAVAVVCEAALWCLVPWISLPAEQGPVRLAFTAIALMVSVALRPLVPERDRAPDGPLVAAAVFPAIAVPLTIVVIPFANSNQPASALRWASLSAEDAAAWVSQAYATLRLEHVPTTALESEYVGAPPIPATTGVLLRILGFGQPPTSHLVTATMDSVFASWMLCASTLALAALIVQLLVLPVPSETLHRQSIATTIVASFVVQLAAWSIVLVLTIPQHLTLSWAGTTVAALAIVITAVGRSQSTGLAACATLALVMSAAATSWPFGLVGVALAGMGCAWMLWREAGRRAALPIVGIALGLVPGVVSGLGVLNSVGPTTLLTAVGSRVPVSLYIAVVLAGAVFLTATAPGVETWPRTAVVVTACGLASGALVVIAGQMLPISTSGYARDKVAYLALFALPLALAASTPWVSLASSAVVRWVLLFGVALVLVSLPYTGGGLTWAIGVEGQGMSGFTERLAEAAAGANGRERLVCLPSARQSAYKNYYCQRWLDALSFPQSDGTLREVWYSAGGGDRRRSNQGKGDAFAQWPIARR